MTSPHLSKDTPPKDILLRLDSLSVGFPIRRGVFKKKIGEVKAVNDVSLTLHKGETLGVVGESGCGKTTLGRAIVRLLEPTGGKIFFHGRDITALSESELVQAMRRSVQMVFQDPYGSLNPRMNVQSILEEPLILGSNMTHAQRLERVRELMELVGLQLETALRYPHEFSGGQRQRIGIARALALNPELIICDEAVSALDVSIASQVINLFKEIQSRLGLAYLFISHDLSVVRYMSDRVAVMYLGQVVEVGSTELLYNEPLHPYSQALLASQTTIDPKARRGIHALEGEVPSPANPPSGCFFHPRCKFATKRCTEERPSLKVVDGREVACFETDATAKSRKREIL